MARTYGPVDTESLGADPALRERCRGVHQKTTHRIFSITLRSFNDAACSMAATMYTAGLKTDMTGVIDRHKMACTPPLKPYHEYMSSPVLNLPALNWLIARPEWLGMSWEARGMAMTIMALGLPDKGGCVPGDASVWRAALGVPGGAAVSRAATGGWGAGSNKTGVDAAWQNGWMPELARWFVLIDADLVARRPDLADRLGLAWHPLVDFWAAGDGAVAASPVLPAKKPAKRRKTVVASSLAMDAGFDYPALRYPPDVLRKSWEVPINKEARMTLWQQACELLADGRDSGGQAGARALVGKLIKEYGESNVARVVAQTLVRPMRPADPKAFIKKQLQELADGGNAKVQTARGQRSSVAL